MKLIVKYEVGPDIARLTGKFKSMLSQGLYCFHTNTSTFIKGDTYPFTQAVSADMGSLTILIFVIAAATISQVSSLEEACKTLHVNYI